MPANNKTNNILIYNTNNVQLLILFPILTQLTDWKSVLATTMNIRPSPISEDIWENP